jgi:hypothetical protein
MHLLAIKHDMMNSCVVNFNYSKQHLEIFISNKPKILH